MKYRVSIIGMLIFIAIALFTIVCLIAMLMNGIEMTPERARCESIGGRYSGECYYNGQVVNVDEIVDSHKP